MRIPKPRTLIVPAAGILLTLAMGTLCLMPPQLFVFLDEKIYDSFLKASPHQSASDSVVIVDLDESSIAVLGQWPWPRYRVAQLLDKIHAAGASAVGLDILFSEPDRTSLELLAREIRQDMGINIFQEKTPLETMNNDQTLASVLADGSFVLGYQFDFDTARGDECLLHVLPAAIRFKKNSTDKSFFNARGVICNLPLLSQAAGASGFFNVTPDSDGVVRRVPLVIRHEERLYPSLALASYLQAYGGNAVIEVGREGIEEVRINKKTIPLDSRGNIVVNYRGSRRSYNHIPAVSVLYETIDTSLLRGKIVLIGTTATGLHEMRTTPLEAAQPGVEIHATIVDNLISGDAIGFPRWSLGLQFFLVLFPGMLLTFLLVRARAIWGLAVVAPCAAFIWQLAWWLLAHQNVYFSPLLPISTLGLIFTTVTSLRYMETERDMRERTRKLSLTQDAIIQSLAALAETRHHETGGHIQRTRHYIRALAVQLKDHPRFRHFLNNSTIDLLFRLAPLHDIGKVGVTDQVLLKPTRLSEDEYEDMKKHTDYGTETIRLAKNFLGEDSFLQMAEEIVANHHERWDGLGYPRGLRGDDIPIPGRLMAVADSYDAIISPRLYKPAISSQEAILLIQNLRGTYFDPDVVDAFLAVSDKFAEIATRFASSGVEPEPPKGF
ncbi:MAG: CHASE2 domain-containing protein [Syntrophorhabdaceae bacterium]|nr:CHASE2 domain-containing protein [Syntrophorhabdaceae bacterium]